MKMFVTPNFVQHNRLIRLVMLLIIVGLSIFLYTSYYANQTMERFPTSQRFHMPSLISVSSILEAESSASASASAGAGTGNAIDDDNTFQSNGINDKAGIDSNSNSNNNGLVQPAESASIDTSNDSQIRQQLLGNNLNDILSNSVAQFNVNNIVQQTNLPGECNTLIHNYPFRIRLSLFITFVVRYTFLFGRCKTSTFCLFSLPISR